MFTKLALIATLAATVLAGGKTVRRSNQTWYFADNKANFSSAEQQCKKRGMKIASINNMGEQKIAEKYAKGENWIALNDRKREKHWVNADGHKVTFTHWTPGQPNNWRKVDQDCTVMNWINGKWNDVRCSRKFRFICKKTKKVVDYKKVAEAKKKKLAKARALKAKVLAAKVAEAIKKKLAEARALKAKVLAAKVAEEARVAAADRRKVALAKKRADAARVLAAADRLKVALAKKRADAAKVLAAADRRKVALAKKRADAARVLAATLRRKFGSKKLKVNTGWCGPESQRLSSGTYPNCVNECRNNSDCTAVRWVESTKKCALMKTCPKTNTDGRYRHAYLEPKLKANTGWCGPDGERLSSGTYPNCVNECVNNSVCTAVRWVANTKKCDLMKTCPKTANDGRWRHAFLDSKFKKQMSIANNGKV